MRTARTRAATSTTTVKHPVDQVLPFPQMFFYGLQHVLSMYAGVVAVPLIVGTALKLSATDITYLVSAGLFISGLATLLQTLGIWKIGARQPIVQGTSFAAVSTMLAIGAAQGGGEIGLRAIFGALLLSGAIAFFIAPLFTKLLRFFPEVVTGTVITIIGVSLLPVAIKWAGGGTPGVTPTFGAPKNIALAGITVLIIVLIYRFLPPALSRVAILLGLVLGSVVAIPFGLTNFKAISNANVTNGLRADMLSTAGAAVFNGFSVSAFAQNVGLVAITGIKSRFVVAVSGGILVFLGLFPVLGALVALVPLPVLGGAGLALFGTVAASGIRTLSKVDFSGNANIVIVAFALSMGIIPIAVPTFYDKFPAWFTVIFDSGITSAALTAVVLNIVFNIIGRPQGTEGPIFSEAPAPASISDEDEARLDPQGRVARGLAAPIPAQGAVGQPESSAHLR